MPPLLSTSVSPSLSRKDSLSRPLLTFPATTRVTDSGVVDAVPYNYSGPVSKKGSGKGPEEGMKDGGVGGGEQQAK